MLHLKFFEIALLEFEASSSSQFGILYCKIVIYNSWGYSLPGSGVSDLAKPDFRRVQDRSYTPSMERKHAYAPTSCTRQNSGYSQH